MLASLSHSHDPHLPPLVREVSAHKWLLPFFQEIRNSNKCNHDALVGGGGETKIYRETSWRSLVAGASGIADLCPCCPSLVLTAVSQNSRCRSRVPTRSAKAESL